MAEPARYLLDTHAWFWLMQGAEGKLGRKTVSRLESAALTTPLLVSVISVWELAMLDSKGRIGLQVPVREWVRMALERPGLRLIGLDPDMALESCVLPGDFHADPADRFLVAAARLRNLTLVTRDQRVLDYAGRGYLQVLAA